MTKVVPYQEITKMKIGLVSSGLEPVIGVEYNMPLGLLSLSGVAEQQGHSVELLQLPLSSPQQNIDSPMNKLAEMIAERDFDLVGFTTRCDSLPIAVEVAKRYKILRPDIPTVFGGPGATFVEKQLLESYHFINIIVRGEGEFTFAELLKTLDKKEPLKEVEGISYRTKNGEIVVNKNRSTLCDLDSLPSMPFHLVSDTLKNPELIKTDVAIGRGCPNGCRFCSTCAFWGRKPRTRSVERVISEMKILRYEYGFKYFNLVDDNLFGYKNFLPDLCHSIQEHLPDINFNVFVSMNFVTPELVELLAKSGCTDAFVGLETGSKRLAWHLRSKFCLPETTYNKLDIFRKNKIHLTKSFMVGFPDGELDDTNKTLMYVIEVQATAPIAFMETIVIHPLGIHPGTELYDDFCDRLHFSPNKQIIWIIQKLTSTKSIRNHCERFPKVFTAYASHMNDNDFCELVELCAFYQIMATYYPKSLVVLLAELKMTPISFFKYFQDFLLSQETKLSKKIYNEVSDGRFRPFYLREFSIIVNKLYQEEKISPKTVQIMLDVESPRTQVFFNRYKNFNLYPNSFFSSYKLMDMVPIVPKTTQVRSFTYDCDVVFSQFHKNGCISTPINNDKVDLLYFLRRYAIALTSKLSFNVAKLDVLNKYIIENIDGVRSCREIVEKIVSNVEQEKQDKLQKLVENKLKSLIRLGVLLLSNEIS